MRRSPLLVAGLLMLLAAAGPGPAQAAHDDSVLVRCESVRGRDNYCAVDTQGGVYLVDRLSDSRCVEGETWGVDRGGIWVSQGCRADFEVAPARGGRGNANSSGYGRPWQDDFDRGRGRQGVSVVCESHDRRVTHCPIRVRTEVELVEQYSSAECRYNSTWGYDARGIWVDRGCRAEFAVY